MNDRNPAPPSAGGSFRRAAEPGVSAEDVRRHFSSSQLDSPSTSFPSTADVYAAAAAIPRTVPRWQGEVGPRWQITIMPGGVQLGTKDFGRIARSEEERTKLRLSQDISMTLLDAQPGSRRGAVLAWSAKSRARMVKTLCAIDYALITGDGCTPGMVTLTMPHDWEIVAPTPAHFKKMVNNFRARYHRAYGHAIAGIWKMEFQERAQCRSKGCHDPQAPHLHILTDVPQTLAPRPLSAVEVAHLRGCKRDECAHDAHFRADLRFEDWLSHAWALSVGHPNPDEYAKHLSAGTNVSYEDSLRYGDAKRIAVYFTKHGTFANKAYQNELPQVWRSAIEDDAASGANFWGRWVVPVVRAIQETDEALIMHIMSSNRFVSLRADGGNHLHSPRVDTSLGEAGA